MNVLVLNAGSSSLRFQVIETEPEHISEEHSRRLVRGTVESIGGRALITLHVDGQSPTVLEAALRDHRAAIEKVLTWLVSPQSGIPELDAMSSIDAVGHRIVHGGQRFRSSVLIDDEVLVV